MELAREARALAVLPLALRLGAGIKLLAASSLRPPRSRRGGGRRPGDG